MRGRLAAEFCDIVEALGLDEKQVVARAKYAAGNLVRSLKRKLPV